MQHPNKKEALKYHSKGRPGKTEIIPTKPASSTEDIALAYTPGASFPSSVISSDKWNAYRYTNKGNLIGLLSNGESSIAEKPLMESKSMLMKTFADIDSFDIELSEEGNDELVKIIQSIAPTFGGISIGGIKSNDGIILQEKLQQLLGIPVLHDEAYGVAVTIAAFILNYFKVAHLTPSDITTALIGSGTTTLATLQLIEEIGIFHRNIIFFENSNKHTQLRTMLGNCQVIISTEKEQALMPDILDNIPANAAIVLLAPQSDYKAIKNIHPDAIIATGNILMPNFIDSILASPYIFRGALDTLSTSINKLMIKAAINSLASLFADSGKNEQLLPKYNDTRLAITISSAVAQAAIESGIARRKITNWKEYHHTMLSRLERIYNMSQHIRHYGKQTHRLHRRYIRAIPEY